MVVALELKVVNGSLSWKLVVLSNCQKARFGDELRPPRSKKRLRDDFCAAEHVLVSPEGGGFYGMTDRILGELGRRRNVSISVPSFLMAPSLVARTDCICMLPRRLAALYPEGLDIIEPPFEATTFKVDLLWHTRRQHDPSHVWFREQVAQVLSTI